LESTEHLYVVNEQKREIAIRLALGAQRGTILKMSCAADSFLPPLAPLWVWPLRSSSLISWPDCLRRVG